VGDALGATTEFIKSQAEILAEFGGRGPQNLQGWPATITDDTQMTLSVASALVAAPRPYKAQTLVPYLVDAFVSWYDSPLNNRGPGRTCLDACERLVYGLAWPEATVPYSKGCGTVMRVAPVALVGGPSLVERAAIAQLQAAITHGHPTGLAAADLTMYALYLLRQGYPPAQLVPRLRDYAESQRTVYHGDWLPERLWQRFVATPDQQAAAKMFAGKDLKTPRRTLDRALITSGETYISLGWEEIMGVLDDLDEALSWQDVLPDAADSTGEGWAADSALGSALYSFLVHLDDPLEAVRHAARSRGDSDSLASIVGALIGTTYGQKVWPASWTARVESREILRAFGHLWD
jgi:ADP-ribosylglycohydrolase